VTTALDRRGRALAQGAPGRSVVIATGPTTSRTPWDPGEDLPHVSHYFDEPHACHAEGRRRGREQLRRGAALALFRAGALVTSSTAASAVRLDQVLGQADIENRIAENAIAARFETEVVRIGRLGRGRGPEGREEIPPRRSTSSRLPPHGPLGGRSARGRSKLEPEHDPQTLETNVRPLRGRRPRGRLGGHRVFIETGASRHDRSQGISGGPRPRRRAGASRLRASFLALSPRRIA